MDYEDYNFSQQRLKKRQNLINTGINPFPSKCIRSHTINDVVSKKDSNFKEVDIVGRIRIIETSPDFSITLEDATNSIKIIFDQKISEHNRIIINNLDKGDFIGVNGVVCYELPDIYLKASRLTILTKAVLDLPEPIDWANDKIRQRSERYIDLAIRNETKKLFQTRINLIRNIRGFLNKQGMCEVETPILRSWYDVVCFNQFETHDLDGRSLFLRVCHEDRLKLLISGGFEKVFELGKSFRPSDASWKHNVEFLQLETIQAYTDYTDMMKHAEDLYTVVTKETIGKMIINGRNGDKIDLSPPWRKISVRDAIKKYSGIDIYEMDTVELLRSAIVKSTEENISNSASNRIDSALPPADSPKEIYQLPPQPYSDWFWGLVEHCIGYFVEPNLIQPTILYDYPVDSNWYCKRKSDNPDYIERFEAYIDGIEIANCYTLVNDVVDFIERLEDQRKWYFSAFGKEDLPLDKSLINAKAYGLPPMSESSFGIERWLMLICEQKAIQDVIWIPYPDF